MSYGADWASVDDNNTRVPPDLVRAKSVGLAFAGLRCAFGTIEDPTFKTDWQALHDAQIPSLAYLFPQYPRPGKKVPEPEDQADNAIHIVGELDPKLHYPIAIDVEFDSDVLKETGLQPLDMIAWLDRIRVRFLNHYGIEPFIYTSWRIWYECFHQALAPQWKDCPAWLTPPGYIVPAHYPAITNPIGSPDPKIPPWFEGQWLIEQHQGDAKGLIGFSHQVDMNRFNSVGQGSKNGTVRFWRKRLGLSDGDLFDKQMLDSVVQFQQDSGLANIDGVIGTATAAPIFRLCSDVKKPLQAA